MYVKYRELCAFFEKLCTLKYIELCTFFEKLCMANIYNFVPLWEDLDIEYIEFCIDCIFNVHNISKNVHNFLDVQTFCFTNY